MKNGESSFIQPLLWIWTSVLYCSKHPSAVLRAPKLRLPLRDPTREGDAWRLLIPRLIMSPLAMSTELLIYAFGQCSMDMVLRYMKALFEENSGDALAFGKVTWKSHVRWKYNSCNLSTFVACTPSPFVLVTSPMVPTLRYYPADRRHL
jgi:hypothetical protein